MIIKKLKVRVFEKGDYVRTGDGVGIVVDCNFDLHKDGSILYYEVNVQHKNGTGENPSNNVKSLDGFESVSLISKHEYDKKEW
jgi:hypothetical protein